MTKLIYSITGLDEFSVSFENYCTPCEWQGRCKNGRDSPLEIVVSCKELKAIEDELRFKHVSEVQRKGGDMTAAYEKKMPASKILSGLWKKKIKAHKDEIFCQNTHNLDLIIVANRSKEWWREFAKVGKQIIAECSKIM